MKCLKCRGHGKYNVRDSQGGEYVWREGVACESCGGDGKLVCQWEGCPDKATEHVEILLDQAGFCSVHSADMIVKHGAVLVREQAQQGGAR